MSLILERFVLLIFGFALLVLALIGGATYRSLTHTQRAMEGETHTRGVQLHLEKMELALIGTETNARGFIMLDSEEFLKNFNTDASLFRSQLQQLRELTADSPVQQERLQTLQLLGEKKIATSQKYIELRRATGSESAMEEFKLGVGRSLSEQIRPLTDELEREELRLLEERRAVLAAGINQTIFIILVGSSLAVLSLVLSSLVIVRQLTRRRQAESALAEANARLEKRVKEQSEDLSNTSDELRLENIRRALAEKNERDRLEWWRITLNSIGDCVITTDTEGKINFVNRMAQEVTEWSLEEAIGAPLERVFRIVNEGTLQPVESPITKVLREGVTIGLANHTSLVTKGGRHLPIDDSGAPIRDDDGNIIGAVLVFRDFTQQRQAEFKLQQLEETQRLALEAGKMGIFAWNPQTDELQTDHRMRALFGKDDDDVIEFAAPLFAAVHPEDRPALNQNIKDVIKKQAPYNARFRVNLPDGTMRWIAGTGQVETDARGFTIMLRGINYDITEQIEAEEKLRESEERYRLVAENASDVIITIDQSSTILYLNRAAQRVFGHKLDEMIGQSLTMLMPEYLRHLHEAGFARYNATGTRHLNWEHVEIPGLHRDGHEIPLELSFSESHLRGKHVFIGIARDVSERRQAEMKLRESEEFNRSIFENSPDCVKILKLDGTVHLMNSNGMCLMEIDDFSAYAGQQWVDFWPNEYQESARQAVQTAAQGKTVNFQGFCLTAKGTPKWWDVSMSSILNDKGQPVRLISTARDITERKAQDNALRINEIRFRTLTETIPQLVWTCRPDGECAYLSNRWMEYTGTTLEQNLGYGWLQAVHPDDAAPTQEVWAQAVATSNVYQTEFRLRHADGGYRWHLARAVRVNDEAGDTVTWFGTCTDIEDHKRAEVERAEMLEREQKLRSKAEEANRMKDEFVATVSHELRSPLNAILGWARMMRAGTLDAATTRNAVDVIERSADNQARLIDDLLEMSRIITGKLRLDLKTLDPSTVVRTALEAVLPTAKAKDISIQSNLDPNINAIAGDANRLQQIIWNLLSNAIKFTPKGGRINVQLFRDASQIVFTVTDTGQGIDPEFLPYVFDRFRQADATSIRKHGGLGLGLSIARHLVELHGGVIAVESKGQNQGATFTVRLPILPVQLPNEEQEPETELSINLPAPDTEAILSGLFILAVDDEPDARQLLAQILTAYGATVTTTDSAESALEIIQQQQPDLLVSDIGMPNNDGYALIRRVREAEQGHPRRMPAIALTAYARPRDRMKALAAGFNHHVPKPVEPAELVTVITSLTGRLNLSDS